MRLGLHANAPRVIPCNNAGIVVKHREQPVNVVLHVVSGFHDVRFEQGIDHRVFARLMVDVVNF